LLVFGFFFGVLVFSQTIESVAQSEAEYVAAASCCSQLLRISYTICDFGEKYAHVPLQCDSISAISIAKNPVLHSKTKHIEVRYLSYGPPLAHYLGGYQDQLLGGPMGLPGLRYTAPDGVEHRDYGGEVLG
jgi:hypothetical protein